MSSAEMPHLGPDVFVAEDGSVPAISAELLARYGLNRPGAHLRLVEVSDDVAEQRPLRGILKDVIDDETAEAISQALTDARSDRINAIEHNAKQ